jgi:hypothetical protein
MTIDSSYQRDLASARAKLGHAQRHIGDLHTVIDLFFQDESHRPSVMADFDPSSEYHILRIKSVPDLDPLIEDVSLLVGDTIHDLRSALDHVAWQFACQFANGEPANPTQVYFPICAPRPGRAHVNPAFLHPADWQVLHEFQPCKGINGRPDSWSGDYIHQLSQLQKMSNEDKHRRLPIVILTPNLFSTIPTRLSLPPWIIRVDDSFEFHPELISDPDPEAEHYDFSQSGKRAELGAEVGRIRAPAWRSLPVIEEAGEVIPRVACEGPRPIFAVLDRLAVYVQLILDVV